MTPAQAFCNSAAAADHKRAAALDSLADDVVHGGHPKLCLPDLLMSHCNRVQIESLIELLCMAVAAPDEPIESRPHQPTKAEVLDRADQRLRGIVASWLTYSHDGIEYAADRLREAEDEREGTT